jgi:homoserine kinase type II
MGIFTKLSVADLTEVADVFRLGAVRSATGIEAGTVNTNYRLDTALGTLFLRLNEGKREDEVAYEAQLISHLSARGVVTPCPRLAQDGRPYARIAAGFVTVFPWAPGAHRSLSELSAADVRAAGLALARLHQCGEGFPERRPSRYALAPIVLRYRGFQHAPEPALATAVRDLGEEIAWLDARAPARASLPQGIIHGDLFPDNVLFEGSRLSALLDFEQASDGALVYDLAVCLLSWCYVEDFVPERVRALCQGYEEVRALSIGERQHLYTEARAASLRFCVTRITDVFLRPDVPESLKASKDYRRYHARLLRLRALGAEGFARLVAGAS